MTYKENPRGVDAYLNYDRDLRMCLQMRANLGLQAARASAPRGGGGDPHAGRLAASGSVVDNGARSGGPLRDRMSFSVVFNDPAAVSIIFGTKDTPSHMGMIRATIAAMGDAHHNPAA